MTKTNILPSVKEGLPDVTDIEETNDYNYIEREYYENVVAPDVAGINERIRLQ